jgi:hypothetical protein
MQYIYQFATDNVKSNTTVKSNTCSFDNKCCKKLWIAVYNQSTTVSYMPVHHYKTISKTHHTSMKAARRLTRVLHHPGSTFQPQAMFLLRRASSTHPQRSSVQINNIDTQTSINDIIAPDEYQALLWVSCESKHCEHWKTSCMHSICYTVVNIRPLGSACCVNYN